MHASPRHRPRRGDSSSARRRAVAREQCGQGTILRRLQRQGDEPTMLGVVTDSVQEYGLADPAQSHHQQALGREAVADAVESNRRGFDQAVSPREFRWRRTVAGSVGISSWVHRGSISSKVTWGYQCYPRLSRYQEFGDPAGCRSRAGIRSTPDRIGAGGGGPEPPRRARRVHPRRGPRPGRPRRGIREPRICRRRRGSAAVLRPARCDAVPTNAPSSDAADGGRPSPGPSRSRPITSTKEVLAVSTTPCRDGCSTPSTRSRRSCWWGSPAS